MSIQFMHVADVVYSFTAYRFRHVLFYKVPKSYFRCGQVGEMSYTKDLDKHSFQEQDTIPIH